MWIKKINEFFNNLSEYDNNSLLLHVAVDMVDMFKERILFSLDDEGDMNIKVLSYGDVKEDIEIDEDGFLYWLQFTFHKELIDIILSLKQKYTSLQNSNKQLTNDTKLTNEEGKRSDLNTQLTKNNKEIEALSMIMNKVDTYRRNTFAYLRDKDSIEQVVTHIKIYLEQSD